jgi:aminoglycoside phosphotransferase (APT) family kinase protein
MAQDPDGARMAGGRTGGAVRRGDAVHRPVRPWTPAVHQLLRYLEDVGFDGAPRVLGFDDQGQEVLSYLEGDTVGDDLPWPSWVHSAGQRWQPGLVHGHHDAAPYNAVWRDGLVGFVDWDTAGPSSRELDLAFTALAWVPLLIPKMVEPQGFTAFADRSRRLHLLLDAYGYTGDRTAFGAEVASRARVNAAGIRRLAAGGDPTYVALLPVAVDFEQAAREVEVLPRSFWLGAR